MALGWVTGILGIWVGITPFFGASPAFYAWNNWIAGAIVAILGFSMIASRPAEGWISGLVGVWLFISGFIPSLLLGSGLWWNSIPVGVVLLVVGFAAARPAEHGGHAHAHPSHA